MADLARPSFIDRNPETLLNEAIALFEQTADRTLYPAQVERLILGVLSYSETLVRIAIQNAAEQNLVNYATGLNLDQLGALLDVERLPESAAQTTLSFTLSSARAVATLIPEGTRAMASGATVNFATNANAVIPAGALSVTAIATATTTGATGNDFAAGTITDLIDLVSGVSLSVSNTTISSGGADIESDERFRTRIKLAPNQFSVAGSEGAYRYWALTADQSIIDVAVLSPARVRVQVYPLLTTGLPGSELLSKVLDVLDDDKIRPLTDDVEVLAPTQVNYTIAASVTLLNTADADALSAQLNAAAIAYTAERRAGLGRDIVRSQIIAALSLSGVYSVVLTTPAADIVIAPNEWADCNLITVNVVGTSDG